MTRKAATLTAMALAVLGAMLAAGAIAAADGQDGGRGRWDPGSQLAGTWTVTVNRPAPQPPLTFLQVFTDEGSTTEMPNEWPATRTPAYGVWEHVEGRLYASTHSFFRFDPQTGAYLGRTRIDRTMELAPNGQTFRFVARVTVFDPAGNAVATLRPAGTAERMGLERIPERP